MERNPISIIVKILMATDDVEQHQLADPAGISEATVSRRLKKGGWSAEELDGLAQFFDVPVGTFFRPPDDVRAALIARYAAAA